MISPEIFRNCCYKQTYNLINDNHLRGIPIFLYGISPQNYGDVILILLTKIDILYTYVISIDTQISYYRGLNETGIFGVHLYYGYIKSFMG
jgi:hypothetical protein